MKIGNQFFSRIKYNGIGSAEFKYDLRDGKYKLIELNPRYWQQNGLSTKCGINFPLVDFLYQSHDELPINKIYEFDVKWINIYSDFNSFLDYRKEKIITFWSWLKSLKGKKVWSDFSLDDPIPGFYQIGFGKRITEIPRYLKKKFF